MDKQVIKITESDLHKIVKESVNKVLTELDWRTYANAAKKRDAQIQQRGEDATDKGGKPLSAIRNDLDFYASNALRVHSGTDPTVHFIKIHTFALLCNLRKKVALTSWKVGDFFIPLT